MKNYGGSTDVFISSNSNSSVSLFEGANGTQNGTIKSDRTYIVYIVGYKN